MPAPIHHPPGLVYSPGTQVVITAEVAEHGRRHARGSVGVVLRHDGLGYRVRFLDGAETTLPRDSVTMLERFKQGDMFGSAGGDLFDRVMLKCVIGSRAYGLESSDSDTDRRGVFLPSAARHWSLAGVPEQIENDATQEAYWELRKFLVLALKANPNVLECLYTPIIEVASPLGGQLLAMREVFLSRLVYQTYNGYVLSQFKKLEGDLRNRGEIKWKHAMHLIRLLLAGIGVLKTGVVPVRVDEHRDTLLKIKRGQTPWDEVDRWRRDLHREFDAAFAATRLPEQPDYAAADRFLIQARSRATAEVLP